MTQPIRRAPSTGSQTTASVVGGVMSLGMLVLAVLALATGARWAISIVLWVVVGQSLLWLLMKVVKSK